MLFVILSLTALGAVLAVAVLLAMAFRIVVRTNDVHIVQSAKKTISYGKDQLDGNVYYHWPSWVPVYGVKVIVLPVSVFSEKLEDYAAYDIGRLPFKVDVMAFFRIKDSNIAAQRVASFQELQAQLRSILQGAIRSVLASADIETILSGRREFGHKFTDEVEAQLTEWGVTNVKTIELMDIRDTDSSKVIANIMAKQKSVIEKDSRVAVAENMRAAQEAEVVAIREVEVRKQEAQQQVGIRTEQAQQAVKDQAKITAEKDMAVRSVNAIRSAEIEKQAQIVAAEQNKATTILAAEAGLEQAKRHAEGVEIEGRAKGEAETAILMAPVNAQTALAKEIGQNAGYQTYLVGIRQIEANQVVGVEQAKALQVAEIKVISNSGSPVDGVTNVMGLLTPKGGAQIGAMLEAFKNTDVGAEVLGHMTGTKPNGAGTHTS